MSQPIFFKKTRKQLTQNLSTQGQKRRIGPEKGKEKVDKIDTLWLEPVKQWQQQQQWKQNKQCGNTCQQMQFHF